MKKTVGFVAIAAIALVAACFLIYPIFTRDAEADALRRLFYPPQWETFDFSKRITRRKYGIIGTYGELQPSAPELLINGCRATAQFTVGSPIKE